MDEPTDIKSKNVLKAALKFGGTILMIGIFLQG
jgi:hypothetical protein